MLESEEGPLERQEEGTGEGCQEGERGRDGRGRDGQCKYVFRHRILHNLKENVACEDMKIHRHL